MNDDKSKLKWFTYVSVIGAGVSWSVEESNHTALTYCLSTLCYTIPTQRQSVLLWPTVWTLYVTLFSPTQRLRVLFWPAVWALCVSPFPSIQRQHLLNCRLSILWHYFHLSKDNHYYTKLLPENFVLHCYHLSQDNPYWVVVWAFCVTPLPSIQRQPLLYWAAVRSLCVTLLPLIPRQPLLGCCLSILFYIIPTYPKTTLTVVSCCLITLCYTIPSDPKAVRS